jgi:hypothetical protein
MLTAYEHRKANSQRRINERLGSPPAPVSSPSMPAAASKGPNSIRKGGIALTDRGIHNHEGTRSQAVAGCELKGKYIYRGARDGMIYGAVTGAIGTLPEGGIGALPGAGIGLAGGTVRGMLAAADDQRDCEKAAKQAAKQAKRDKEYAELMQWAHGSSPAPCTFSNRTPRSHFHGNNHAFDPMFSASMSHSGAHARAGFRF